MCLRAQGSKISTICYEHCDSWDFEYIVVVLYYLFFNTGSFCLCINAINPVQSENNVSKAGYAGRVHVCFDGIQKSCRQVYMHATLRDRRMGSIVNAEDR